MTTGLLALIFWTGNASAAARALKAEGKLDVAASTLTSWSRERYAERYSDLREKYQEQIEQEIIKEQRELIGLSLQTVRAALEKSQKRLDDGRDDDPGRTAANVARVHQSLTDKMLSLSGRPTSIREDRNVDEILRSLQARGVIHLPESDVQVETQPRIAEAAADGTGA